MRKQPAFARDLGIIALSILVAAILIQSNTLAQLFALTGNFKFIDSFIAGFFFTSIFTTAPAIAAFGEMSLLGSLPAIAFFGALGAVCGDYLIFKFMRDTFAEHLSQMIELRSMRRRFGHLFKVRFFRQFTFLLGGIIIASPLPDELGLSLLGFSKVKTSWFLPLSFVFNFIGIYAVGLAARALL
jgi:hypothetical protein